jgi:copper resistance protein B
MGNKFLLIALLFLSVPTFAHASSDHEHGGGIFHAFTLETDIGANRDGSVTRWDLDGWIGTDYHKLWLKSEGEKQDGEPVEHSEYWGMYSYNMATFWDVQAGIRYDDKPDSLGYAVLGFSGLAPYGFETEAHVFLSEDGDITARLHEEYDLLITQKLIMQPYMELNLAAQDVPEQAIGSGLTQGEFGLQTRYEFTRAFAPYVDIRYEAKFGETAAIARHHGENRDDVIASVGLRVTF